MANEIAQWVVLGIVAFLLLGAFRQLSLMLPAEARSAPGGPAVGRRLPGEVVEAITKILRQDRLPKQTLIAFVAESCVGCQRLLSEASSSNGQSPDRSLVLVAKTPSPEFRAAIEETGIPAIYDHGSLWDSCNVTSTPLIVSVDDRGRVRGKEVTHRVDRLEVTA